MIEQCMRNLGDRLNEVCRKNGEMQKCIAAKSGVSDRELRRIMSGRVKDIRLSTFVHVAKVIGASAEELISASPAD